MTRAITIAAMFALTGACATTDTATGEPLASGEGPCNAETAQHLVGEEASQALAAEAMRLSGARELRWIPPDSAVTMDYRPTRLNIEYDRSQTVNTIRCG